MLKPQLAPEEWEKEIDAFARRLVAFGRMRRTVTTRVAVLRTFGREIGLSPGEVTEDVIINWASQKQWKPETRHSKYCTFRQFFHWYSVTHGIADPAADLPSVRRPIPPARPIPEEVLAEAIQRADDRMKLILRLAGSCGLRASEIAQVNRKDLCSDLFGPALAVNGKGGRIRIVPLPGNLAEDIEQRSDPLTGYLFPGQHDGHLSPGYISKLAAQFLPKTWTLHTLRHRCATQAYRVNNDLLTVQNLLGHADVSTTQRYVRTAESGMRTAVEAIAI
ncbi:tyrosine-type recombinase/integrase [Trueperella sp. LYQ143]|uniref:tyrosine-type recombinase/integrase n=1 Tax=Trueperella sp. LYQ143 TaxID=3391059 RepID=UPI0039835CC2